MIIVRGEIARGHSERSPEIRTRFRRGGRLARSQGGETWWQKTYRLSRLAVQRQRRAVAVPRFFEGVEWLS